MAISRKTWLSFFGFCCLSVICLWQFAIPRFQQVRLNVEKHEAIDIARDFLRDHTGIDPRGYERAVMFVMEHRADRYLQKTLKFEGEQAFLRKYDFTLFSWVVRFYQEGQKEEFSVKIDSHTGEITGYGRQLPDSAERPEVPMSEAKQHAAEFLTEIFGLSDDDYDFHSEKTQKYDHRIDYAFIWERDDVYIPWNEDPEGGGAKLLRSVTVSGTEVTGFDKYALSIPEQFNRFLDQKRESGRNLSLLFQIASLGILVGAIFVLINSRGHLAATSTKLFYYKLSALLLGVLLLGFFNYFEYLKVSYPTTQPFAGYVVRQYVGDALHLIVSIVSFLVTCLAAETIHSRIFPNRKDGSVWYYLRSSFFTRRVASRIMLGYCVALMMLGLQSILFEGGYRYAGLWVQQTWVGQVSSAYFPFLAALIVGLRASLFEEATYRMFAVPWLTHHFKRVGAAVLISSLIWGFGHTGYDIFPMWFRGVEVTVLGVFLGWVYLRFGIITVVVAHFLFDVFWSVSGHVFGDSTVFHTVTCSIVLLLPLALAAIAHLLDRPDEEKPLRCFLNKYQLFNLGVLQIYIQQLLDDAVPEEQIRAELLRHNWDISVVESAFDHLSVNRASDGAD